MREKRSIQAHNTCITMFSTIFSTVNPRFLHDDLIFRKNMVYMKNAKERAGFNIFWRKPWKWSLPCQNLQKPLKNNTNHLLCGFLRNWSIGIDENMLLNQGISKNQTSRWINFWRSWPKKFRGDGVSPSTIHLLVLFYTKYCLCKKNHVRQLNVVT